MITVDLLTQGSGKPGQEVWVGESANRNLGGGGFGGSFGSAMWYADALGIKAAIRHSVFCRYLSVSEVLVPYVNTCLDSCDCLAYWLYK